MEATESHAAASDGFPWRNLEQGRRLVAAYPLAERYSAEMAYFVGGAEVVVVVLVVLVAMVLVVVA